MATSYVVLLQDPDDEASFRFMDVVEVDHGPAQAIRRFTDSLEVTTNAEQLYLAIPTRNWNVIARRVIVPAPRIEIGEVETSDWLAGYQRQFHVHRQEPVNGGPLPGEGTALNPDDNPF